MFESVHLTLPRSWTKKIKSPYLLEKCSDAALWFELPEPTSPAGRDILKFNERMLLFADKQAWGYALEPYGKVFEFIPESVERQGTGISACEIPGMLCVDVYFFPCDFSRNPSRHLPGHALRQPVFAVADEAFLQDFADKYILTGPGSRISNYEQVCAIPFSLDRVAILEGYFIDHYAETEKICMDVVKGGTEEEYSNCRRFLKFIKNVGK